MQHIYCTITKGEKTELFESLGKRNCCATFEKNNLSTIIATNKRSDTEYNKKYALDT